MAISKRLAAAELACAESMDLLRSFPMDEDEVIDIPPHRLQRVAKAILDWGVLAQKWSEDDIREARERFGL